MTNGAWVVRIPKPRRRVIGAAGVIVVVLVLVTMEVVSSTKRVELGGISFDVPISWSVHTDIPATTGRGQLLALIGTLPWGPCAAFDINCHFRERPSSQQIEVEVSSNANSPVPDCGDPFPPAGAATT